MKKLLILLCTLYSVLSTTICHAWHIDSYDTTIEIQESGSIIITEEIQANFTTDPHHGIYRNIPTRIAKEDGHIEKLRTNLISITDEQGNPLQYSKYRTTSAQTYQIGDPDVLVQATETYIITYEVLNGLSYFEDHDEIYWNAIGTEWEAEIKQATATVTLPDGITSIEDIQVICYTSEGNCSSHIQGLETAIFQTAQPLNWYESFTIAVAFPTGLVDKPSSILWTHQDYWPIIIIPLVFMFLFRRWNRFGKDKKVHTVIPEYEPPKDITPIEAAILIDERADMKDISAIMIDLAIKGFIQIEEIEEKTLGIFKHKNYILHHKKKTGTKRL